MHTVAHILREHREARGLTLAALAAAVGSTKGYLSMIENGRVANPPSPQLLDALEAALHMPDHALRQAADWERTPANVRAQVEQLADDARRGRELAGWLKENTSRRKGGGKNLDKLHRSGKLRRQVEKTLGPEAATEALRPSGTGGGLGREGQAVKGGKVGEKVRGQVGGVPLINKVAAGFPADFTDLDYPARIADEYIHCPNLDDPDAFAATITGESMTPDYQVGDIIVFSPAADVADGCDCFLRLEPDHDCTFKRVFIDEQTGRIRLQPLNPKFEARIVEREQVAGMYRAVWRMSKL